ncbi:hypothetical protein LSH36_93g01036 [Paralvinella palmiformis]|uniref:Uncharacterized protein n=1 Tax=Paralvinella palmiformis TaxID=53620 RepID=A0AAD9NC14_9ANNE|nr:hypothetical protein LSH36_93g01036 [Paralvinella palmiformis]
MSDSDLVNTIEMDSRDSDPQDGHDNEGYIEDKLDEEHPVSDTRDYENVPSTGFEPHQVGGSCIMKQIYGFKVKIVKTRKIFIQEKGGAALKK